MSRLMRIDLSDPNLKYVIGRFCYKQVLMLNFASNMKDEKLERVIERIDSVNLEDPNLVCIDNKNVSKEWLYGLRMSEMLEGYDQNASDILQIAIRGQHIRRWHIPRKDFPMNRPGYLKWRTKLKLYHGELLTEIMRDEGYDQGQIDEVVKIVTKKKLKTDADCQALEDVACLVFLKYHFHDFAREHSEDKIIDIVQKTWAKMTEKGHEMALNLNYESADLKLIQKALS